MAGRDEAGESLSAVASQLARRWANQRLAAVQAYGRILADYGQGRATSGAAWGAVAKLAVEEAARYQADAIGIATDYAAAVARSAGSDLGIHTTRSDQATVVKDLDLSGPLGGEATGEFYLANPYDHEVAVSFTASHFTSPLGDALVGPSLDPAQFVLTGGAEKKVIVRVALSGGDFQAPRHYSAHVAVAGFDHMILRVRLAILAAA
jgi:hypothetical protein